MKNFVLAPPPEQKFKNNPFSLPQYTLKWTPRHRNEDSYRSKSKLTCFNCGKEGHTSRTITCSSFIFFSHIDTPVTDVLSPIGKPDKCVSPIELFIILLIGY
ncbi:hypothetical protein NPIL_550521 [Nephila pilipes]|uniref:CCHC-type domain-containing protein n=1 Tax=Nephila pilipes TaxID=299642 RepID=A0A8X6ND22_NEPPI|nr:hypothetical protein NPIL_550521 [Nephila pilipes]